MENPALCGFFHLSAAAGYIPAAVLRWIRRLIFNASDGSFRFGVLSKYASSPPLKSIVRNAVVVSRTLTNSSKLSLNNDVFCMFGKNRRRVLLWA